MLTGMGMEADSTNSTRNTQHATRGMLAALGLAGLLALGIGWSVQGTRAAVTWRAGERLLAAGHYQAAVQTLGDAVNTAPPGGAPGYQGARAQLALSWA